MSLTNILTVVSLYRFLTLVHSLSGEDRTEIRHSWFTDLHKCLLVMDNSGGINPPQSSLPISSALVPYEKPVLTVFHEETRKFVIGTHEIVISQDWKATGVAAVVWDAAVVLSEYLVTQAVVFEGRTVLELGAGTGLAGIVAAKLGAKATLTDRGLVLENLQANVDNNSVDCTFKPEVKELEWGQSIVKDIYGAFDFIIGADIIYIEETFPLLLRTLEELTSQRTCVLLSCRIRYNRDSRFLDMMKETFKVTEMLFDSKRGIYVFSAVQKNL